MALDFIPGFITGQSTNVHNTVTNLKNTSTNSKSGSFEKTLYSAKKDNESVRERSDKQGKTDRSHIKEDSRNDTDRKKVMDDKKDKVQNDKKTGGKDDLTTNDAVKSNNAKKTEVNENQPVEHTANEVNNQLLNEQIKVLIDNIAEIIGVTPEQVQSALEKTGLNPVELTNVENISKFIVEAKGLNEAAELLKVPNALEMVKEVNNTVTAAIEKGAVAEEVFAKAKNINADPAFSAETKTAKTADVSAEPIHDQNVKESVTNKQLNTDKGTTGSNNGSGDNLLGGQQQTAQGNSTMTNTGTQDDMAQTPNIVQKGNETVVEAGGKTISRTVANTSKADAESVFNQIAEKMKVNFNSKSTEMRISLKPNELGNVTVKIATESGHVTGEIITESAKVKELVEQNLNELKQTLRQQGVDIGELSVSVGSNETDDRMQRFIQEQEKSKSRLSQIMQKIDGEEDGGIAPVNYADENAANGRTVDFSA